MVAPHQNLAALRSARDVWADVEQDPAWLEDPESVVERIMREAFVAGVRAGAEFAADAITGHADALAKNLVLRLPVSVPNGLRALAARARELPQNEELLWSAWFSALERRPQLKGRFRA